MRLLIVFFIVFSVGAASAQESFIFATHARPPVSNFLREMLQEAFRPLNMNITVNELPGKRVIKRVNDGIADGDPCRVRNFKQMCGNEASNYLIVDEPVLHIEIVMVTHKDTPVSEPSWASVNEDKAAFLRGSKRIRKNIETRNQAPIDNLQQAFKLLKLKRVRSAVIFRSVARNEFQKNPDLAEDLIIHEKPLTSYNMYIYLNRKHSDFIRKLKQSLQKLKADNRFQEIANKYFIAMPVIGKD